MFEEWRDIPGYEGYYQASNLGNIRSVERYITNDGDKKPHRYGGSILKQSLDGRGYLFVGLSKENEVKLERVHRLVIYAFVGRCNNWVDHIDCDIHNNNIDNLRFCTNSENNINRHIVPNSVSGYKGVSKHKKNWRARLKFKGKEMALGTFESPVDAAIAYDEKVREIFGEYGRYNFPQEGERGVN